MKSITCEITNEAIVEKSIRLACKSPNRIIELRVAQRAERLEKRTRRGGEEYHRIPFKLASLHFDDFIYFSRTLVRCRLQALSRISAWVPDSSPRPQLLEVCGLKQKFQTYFYEIIDCVLRVYIHIPLPTVTLSHGVIILVLPLLFFLPVYSSCLHVPFLPFLPMGISSLYFPFFSFISIFPSLSDRIVTSNHSALH